MSKKSFVSGTIVLMLAGFIVKILGFVYKIYLSNIIGAEGIGLFQLISPIYSLIILTLTSGISIAVSKMVAEQLACKHYINLRRITSCAMAIVFVVGIGVTVIMVLFVNPIVNYILKDSRTYYSFLFLMPCIPVIAIASALKGYFYGMSDITPTALSQIMEQVVRIALVMAMAVYFADLGLEYACALATFGMAIGEVSNLLVLFIIYKNKKKKLPKDISKKGLMRKREIIFQLCKISVPVSVNRFIISTMSAVELILIPRMLILGGLSYQEGIEAYGKLTGMAMPLVLFPSLVTASLATILVPAISEGISLKKYKLVNHRISKSVQFTFILGFIFTFIYYNFSNQIGNLLYGKENIGEILLLLSITCVFLYLQQTLLGVLNGLGKQAINLRNTVVGYIIRICFVIFAIPILGLKGYIIGIVISLAVVCVLNLHTVIKNTGMMLDFRNWIIKPGIVCMIMNFICEYVYCFFKIFLSSDKIITIFTITTNAFISLMIMIVFGVLRKNEILHLLGLKK